ncbi:acetyltransferase [Vibrio cholerae]|nr:acetyltransferase [Vibrio cholerae]
MVSVVVFEFSGMRCQPLRRALCIRRIYGNKLARCSDRSY